MELNHFPLTQKCFWNCLNCTKPNTIPLDVINQIIDASSPKTINTFTHKTLTPKITQEDIAKIKHLKQYSATICHSLIDIKDPVLKPDYILFPLFSLSPERHNLYSGKNSFHGIISTFNHTPKPIKKRIIFFVTKDNFSECADLPSFCFGLKTKAMIVPISFFSLNDFDKETYMYLKRLTKYKSLFLSPIHLKFLKSNIPQEKSCYLEKCFPKPVDKFLKYQQGRFYSKFF